MLCRCRDGGSHRASLTLPSLPAYSLASRTAPGAGTLFCVLCKAPMNGRAPKSMLDAHVDSKHSKLGAAAFATCFPTYVPPS